MKLIGEDTQEFLNEHSKVNEYLNVLEADFSAIGINDNYVVLTNIGVEDENIPCVCFYFTSSGKQITLQQGSDILADHSEMLVDLDVLIHFAYVSKEEIDSLIANDNRDNRAEMFLNTVSS